MSDLILYTNPMSRGQIVKWLLEELEVPYTEIILDYGTTMKGAEYLAINPMGKVPAIKHGDNIVTETAAICMYLADAFSDKGLSPQTLAEKARFYRWMVFSAGVVEQAVGISLLGIKPDAKQQMTLGCGNFETVLDVLARAVVEHEYILGDRFTVADVYVGSQIAFYMQFGYLPERPEFIEYTNKLINRPAHIKVRGSIAK